MFEMECVEKLCTDREITTRTTYHFVSLVRSV